MRTRWFGPTWAAPINDKRYKIRVPVGTLCLQCKQRVEDGDRGVAMPIDARGESDVWRRQFTFQVRDGNDWVLACAHHVDCHVEAILGPASKHLVRRRPGDDPGQ